VAGLTKTDNIVYDDDDDDDELIIPLMLSVDFTTFGLIYSTPID